MLIVPPVVYRPRRGRVKATARVAGVALTLIYAYYDENEGVLQLQFDRPINFAALNGAAITVRDGVFDMLVYNGVSAVSVIDPTAIAVTLVVVGSWSDPGETLTVTANSGIVAADDGGTWAGVTDLALPFP